MIDMGLYTYTRMNGKSENSLQLIKKELIKNCNSICNFCGKKFDDRELELEHCVPISIGGSEFDRDNMRMICYRCHKEKTVKDKAILNALKSLRVIDIDQCGRRYWTSTVSQQRLEIIYFDFCQYYDISTKIREIAAK